MRQKPIAPRRALNPFLLRRVNASRKKRKALATLAGFACDQQQYFVLRQERIAATPLMVERLGRLADAIGFPRDEIFLDGLR